MKINSNIPIFIILTVFIASNAFLYKYLNNGYFIDKKPKVEVTNVENVIFRLIADHEAVLTARNNEILLEAERLRNRKLTITDSAELKAIEEKLKQLELESLNVLEKVRNSENERRAAERKAENDQLQLTELLESNNKMGAQLESITSEFNNYVETIKETLISNSFSEKDINSVKLAFRNKKGLDYLNDMVGNIQKNRASLSSSYSDLLQKQSNEYHEGLKDIARVLNNNDFLGSFDEKGLLIPNESVDKLKNTLNRYIDNRDRTFNQNLNSALNRQEDELLTSLKEQLNALSVADSLKLQEALDKQNKDFQAQREKELEEAEKNRLLNLAELEKKLKDEIEKNVEPVITEKIVEKEKIVEVDLPMADEVFYTSWIHLPGLWESTITDLNFIGKKVDTIAWSRNSITDNEILTFNGNFSENGECLIILFGDGKFKSWNNGIIISLKTISPGRVVIDIRKNGISENSTSIFTNSVSSETGISGVYDIKVINGSLSLYLNGLELLNSVPIGVGREGKIGIGNRESNSLPFSLSNIKLFKIR